MHAAAKDGILIAGVAVVVFIAVVEMEITLSDISPWLDDPLSMAQWMESGSFLQLSNIPCQRCNFILQLQTYAHTRDGVVLRCPNWRCRCTFSVRRNSFFASSHIPLTK